MKIHTVFITYNRLELTKRAIGSYLETVSVPFSFIVVDNYSEDETYPWLVDQFNNVWGNETAFLALEKNFYPGYAANRGWESTPADATHLHRADNDFIFLDGWCEEVERCFQQDRELEYELGQLGLRTNEEELYNTHNVGGNCVIPRKLWDEGMRWKETPWPKIKTVGYTEDSYFSPEVLRRGYSWGRVGRPCIQSIAVESPDDPYYQQTWADRGILPYLPS